MIKILSGIISELKLKNWKQFVCSHDFESVSTYDVMQDQRFLIKVCCKCGKRTKHERYTLEYQLQKQYQKVNYECK